MVAGEDEGSSSKGPPREEKEGNHVSANMLPQMQNVISDSISEGSVTSLVSHESRRSSRLSFAGGIEEMKRKYMQLITKGHPEYILTQEIE